MGDGRVARAVGGVVGAGIVSRSRLPRVAALAFVFVLAALAATATRAGGQAPGWPVFPSSLPLRTSAGATVCRVAPMATGAYGAAHCAAAGAPLYPAGAVAAWSVDPWRDLWHFAAHANPSVVLRAAAVGEALYWRNDRAAGEVTVSALGWQVDDGTGSRHYDYCRDACADGERVILTHWRAGSRFQPGDSGTGAHGSDGALVGVLVSACTDPGCAGPQAAGFVQVP